MDHCDQGLHFLLVLYLCSETERLIIIYSSTADLCHLQCISKMHVFLSHCDAAKIFSIDRNKRCFFIMPALVSFCESKISKWNNATQA